MNENQNEIQNENQEQSQETHKHFLTLHISHKGQQQTLQPDFHRPQGGDLCGP